MTLTEKIFTLKSIKPFNQLSDDELILVANTIEEKHYKDGVQIYSKGTNIYSMLMITEGKVTINNEKEYNNRYIGFQELVNDDVLDYDIYASGDVTLLTLSKAHLLTTLYESPSIMIGFLELKSGDKL